MKTILNIDAILNVKPISFPFEHYIVDDILNIDYSNLVDTITDSSKYFQLLGEVCHFKKQILEKYKPHRFEDGMSTHARVNFALTEPDVEREIHYDDLSKIWTCVIYAHPVNSNGTVVYDGNERVGEIEWKVNRGLIFCPRSDPPTFHQIINTDKEKLRATFLINILNDDTGYKSNPAMFGQKDKQLVDRFIEQYNV